LGTHHSDFGKTQMGIYETAMDSREKNQEVIETGDQEGILLSHKMKKLLPKT